MPADDGLGLDDVEGLAPVGPETAEEVPERPVSPFQHWSGRLAQQNLDLMAEGCVLEDQRPTGSET